MKYVTIKQRDDMRKRIARMRLKDLNFLHTLGMSRLERRRRQEKAMRKAMDLEELES